VLVIGRRSQVGPALDRAGAGARFVLDVRDRAALDINDGASVRSTVAGATAVVNAAAITAVDRLESTRDEAFVTNAEAAGILARTCAEACAFLVQLSTDNVFDGANGQPWTEDDPVAPLNDYGASKAQGERLVRATLPGHAIFRTSWVYYGEGRNFLTAMLGLVHRTEIEVVGDQIGAPTPAADVAAAILKVLGRALRDDGISGTWHYAADGAVSWTGFAEAILSGLGKGPKVVPVATETRGVLARRPRNSSLDCGRIKWDFAAPRRLWRDGLASVLSDNLEGAT